MNTSSLDRGAFWLALALMPLASEAQTLSAPVPPDFVITSDFGPRAEGSFFHNGIDYAAGSGRTAGTSVPAIEAATIKSIDRSKSRGWFVRLKADGSLREWEYHHLFVTTGSVQGNSSGRFSLDRVQGLDGPEIAIIKYTDETRLRGEAAYARSAGLRVVVRDGFPLFKIIKTQNHLSSGTLLAPIGNTGNSTNPHLHLALNFTPGTQIADNPLRFVAHSPDQPPTIFPLSLYRDLPGGQSPRLGRKSDMPRTQSFLVDSRSSLDLNRITFFIERADGSSRQEITPPDPGERGLFNYGGNRESDLIQPGPPSRRATTARARRASCAATGWIAHR